MAFSLQEGALSYIRRTVDDLDFDAFDTFDVENPHDNIHAAYGMSINGHYSSAGCQVVVGFPACRNPRFTPEGGPWKIFKQRAYAEAQELFPYFLLEARNAATLADAPAEPSQALLRFGSSGDLGRRLQEKLGGGVDGSFGETTLRAVIELQGHRLGIAEADGVGGGRTASLLDIDWPTL
ncbi:MAG TPA: hypothetical protein VE713_13355 [Pyrinomonadaceae bacterium]|nr:hypothetical protein [Pyrinomonadaceae bacterium]